VRQKKKKDRKKRKEKEKAYFPLSFLDHTSRKTRFSSVRTYGK
jgi:hypothetical protein